MATFRKCTCPWMRTREQQPRPTGRGTHSRPQAPPPLPQLAGLAKTSGRQAGTGQNPCLASAGDTDPYGGHCLPWAGSLGRVYMQAAGACRSRLLPASFRAPLARSCPSHFPEGQRIASLPCCLETPLARGTAPRHCSLALETSELAPAPLQPPRPPCSGHTDLVTGLSRNDPLLPGPPVPTYTPPWRPARRMVGSQPCLGVGITWTLFPAQP